MKYLKKYSIFESLTQGELFKIQQNCEDILVDLIDDDVKVTVHLMNAEISGMFDIYIERDKVIPIRDYENQIFQLIDFLETNGFKLIGGFYESDNWDSYERCPECGSTKIDFRSETFRRQNKYSSREDFSDWTCMNCDFMSDMEDFLTTEYPLNNKGLIENAVRDGDRFNTMCLEFGKEI